MVTVKLEYFLRNEDLLAADTTRKRFIIVLSFDSDLSPQRVYLYPGKVTLIASSLATLSNPIYFPLSSALLALLGLGFLFCFIYFANRTIQVLVLALQLGFTVLLQSCVKNVQGLAVSNRCDCLVDSNSSAGVTGVRLFVLERRCLHDHHGTYVGIGPQS